MAAATMILDQAYEIGIDGHIEKPLRVNDVKDMLIYLATKKVNVEN